MTIETLTGDTSLVLPEFDDPPADPIALLGAWLDTAVDRGVREPYSILLATADSAGMPSSRVVLLKDFDPQGLVFTTHTGSRKGAELAARPYASATFYWRETLQQIHVTGPVQQLPAAASDALFAERPAAAQATTAASRQSAPLDDEAALRQRAADLLSTGGPIARPDGWAGYRLTPTGIEFWHGSVDRLHRRLRYDRQPIGWRSQRLQP
ncbi:phenazine biosynthesis FMN-dependent oxidase PhzG [Dactylosporangium sp. NPDC049525]|uniref:phenazine biosynthesis FMN-dependent oxidase PhzG n=1 Tax=Dactylosporangium sp. NPDC049525 TaxID=3154730 RepID=UPI003419C786